MLFAGTIISPSHNFDASSRAGWGSGPGGMEIVRTHVSSLKHSCKWQLYSILENTSSGGDSVGAFSGMAKTNFWGDPVIAYWGKADTISWGDPVIAFAENTKTWFLGRCSRSFSVEANKKSLGSLRKCEKQVPGRFILQPFLGNRIPSDPAVEGSAKAKTNSWGNPVVAFSGRAKSIFPGDPVEVFQGMSKTKHVG